MELTRRTRGAASFKIIVVIYGGKRRSCLKRERVFKMRETMAVQRSWAYAGKPRPRSRSPSFLPVYRSHAAMSNVVKIPLLHPINYLRFPQLAPRRSRLFCFEIAGEIIEPPRAENRQSRIRSRFLRLLLISRIIEKFDRKEMQIRHITHTLKSINHFILKHFVP